MNWKLVPTEPTEQMVEAARANNCGPISNAIAAAIAAAPSPWIPVSERLPTEEDGGYHGAVLIFRALLNRPGRVEVVLWSSVEGSQSITHWMPMIAGPGEGE